MAEFPSLIPTARSFRLGDYPIKVYRAMSGVIAKRSFGNRATGYQLELEFQNIKQTDLDLILSHYLAQQGTFEGFTLPNSLVAGYTSVVGDKIIKPASIQWFYAEAPDVRSVLKNISTVRVQLIGELV